MSLRNVAITVIYAILIAIQILYICIFAEIRNRRKQIHYKDLCKIILD